MVYRSSAAQFWNIPISVARYQGPYGDINVTETSRIIYSVTLYPDDDNNTRSFLAERGSDTWDNRKKPCLFAGDNNGGPIWEAPKEYGSVIEGTTKDYEVEDVFGSTFTFSKYTSDC